MFTLLPDSFPPCSPFTKIIPDRATAHTKTAILARILWRIEAAPRRESHNNRIHALPDSLLKDSLIFLKPLHKQLDKKKTHRKTN